MLSLGQGCTFPPRPRRRTSARRQQQPCQAPRFGDRAAEPGLYQVHAEPQWGRRTIPPFSRVMAIHSLCIMHRQPTQPRVPSTRCFLRSPSDCKWDRTNTHTDTQLSVHTHTHNSVCRFPQVPRALLRTGPDLSALIFPSASLRYFSLEHTKPLHSSHIKRI